MTGEKLMHDTLHIPDGIDAIFDTIVAQVAENLAGEDANRMKLVVLSGVADILSRVAVDRACVRAVDRHPDDCSPMDASRSMLARATQLPPRSRR